MIRFYFFCQVFLCNSNNNNNLKTRWFALQFVIDATNCQQRNWIVAWHNIFTMIFVTKTELDLIHFFSTQNFVQSSFSQEKKKWEDWLRKNWEEELLKSSWNFKVVNLRGNPWKEAQTVLGQIKEISCYQLIQTKSQFYIKKFTWVQNIILKVQNFQ